MRHLSHREILNAIGDYREIARIMGVHHSTVSRWKSETIPPEHWPAILRLCKQRGVRGVNADILEAGAAIYHRDRYPATVP